MIEKLTKKQEELMKQQDLIMVIRDILNVDVCGELNEAFS